ncbi:CpaD family pilus assembly protein [Ciceribacter sp. L1K23]|uniref:CpaD family pilus assembly protein n=1 Tax=Ciceribacter sp. L1K23 TaxID=2820276 RepID=UPI0020129DF4|nr:CpaD family pilus assembly protein [Ciceribacter sp. L1K23]
MKNVTQPGRKMENTMITLRFRSALTAGVLLSAALMAGCGTRDGMTTGSIRDDYRTRHPIVLNEVEHALDIPVSSADVRLTTGMRDAIGGFGARYSESSSSIVQIMVPQGSPNAGAANHLLKQIRSTLASSGVPASRIVQTTYVADAYGDAAPIRLTYVAMTAVTNACGEWPEDLANDTVMNRNWENFGCATQANLAAQIASPMDLLTPRKSAPIDAARRSEVISDYRNDGNPGL